MKNEKERLRAEYRKIRDTLSEENRVFKSVSVWKYFFELEEYQRAKVVMLYSDIKSEVKTNVFAQRVLSDRKRLVFPVTDKESGELCPYEITEISNLKIGAFGILEPNVELVGSVKEIPKDEIDIIMIPGLVFDMFGGRIGYGGGYYDRFLKNFKGVRVGVAYSDCLCCVVPAEETDEKIDILVTEVGCERFG